MKLAHLSYSTLDDLAQCGEKARLRKLGVPQTPSWAAVGGSAVHTATQALDLGDFGIKTDLPGAFVDALEYEVARTQQRSPHIDPQDWHAAGRVSKDWPNKQNKAWWLANGQGLVDSWRDWLRNGPMHIWITPEAQPAIEIDFTVSIGDTIVRGYIDRVLAGADETLAVVDLKSGARKPMNGKQLGTYAIGLRELWGVRVDWGMNFMVRDGAPTPPVYLTRYGDGRLAYEYANAAKVFEQELFLSKVSEMCGSCSVREFCYAVDGDLAALHFPWIKPTVETECPPSSTATA